MFSSLPFFAAILFCFLVIRLLVCFHRFSPYLLGIYSRCFRMSYIVCIVLSSLGIFLTFLLSPVTFWAISLSCIVFFTCVVFSFFSSKHVPVFSFWWFFASCRRFLFCVCSLTSHPCFHWLVGWLFGFYGISTFIGYLTANPFYANIQFYFKQFSLAKYAFQFNCKKKTTYSSYV